MRSSSLGADPSTILRRGAIAASIAWSLACCSLETAPQDVDLRALVDAPLETRPGLGPGFDDFSILVHAGRDQKTGRPRDDSVVEHRSMMFTPSPPSDRWWVRVDVKLFKTAEAATSELRFLCNTSRTPLPVVAMGTSAELCKSQIVQSRNDPEGLWLPSNQFFSSIYLRRVNLLIALDEAYRGSPSTAKSSVIADLADRFRRSATAVRQAP